MGDNWAIARNIENIIKCEKYKSTLDPDVFIKLLDSAFSKFNVSESVQNYISLVNDVVR